ncbi:MAG: histidine--tRNA ligase [Cyclobacteriaceae bacterium]|nr:histidine--tRNA ligase [Cyclobacteriaceae bacterium]
MEKPTLPKGTRDFGPAVMARRQFILDTIKGVFKKYGFQQLETPAMENLSTLTGKYGEEGDQLLFKVLNSGDYLKNADPEKLKSKDSKGLTFDISEKGLKYDLTVPFARYVVMNRHEVTFPFKRFQIQPVWRADRPQKGRYREFYQCDADVIGTDSLLCEAEIILMIKEVCKGLGIDDFSIKVNHRGILTGLAEIAEAKGNESSLFVAIDKLDKIGEDKVKEELSSKGFSTNSINRIFEILNFKGSNLEKIELLHSRLEQSEKGTKGVQDIKQIIELLSKFDLAGDSFELDIALARGLSYYTGAIFEVKINNVGIGSVSGGGRYDNLTGVFGLEGVSGVGFSFGVDRLYDAMEELNVFPEDTEESTKVLIAHFDEEAMRYGLATLKALRREGIAAEIYPDVSKLKKQLDYANKKKIPYVVVIGSDEMKSGDLTFKNMKTGEQQRLTLEEILIQF